MKLLSTIVGSIIGAAITAIVWLIGYLSPMQVFSDNPFQDFLIFWIVGITATISADWISKDSSSGDFELDLFIISLPASIIFVFLMRQLCSERYWFNSAIFSTGRWIPIVAYIISCAALAAYTKTKVKEKIK